jgi:hypothetical protein
MRLGVAIRRRDDAARLVGKAVRGGEKRVKEVREELFDARG